MLAIYTRYLGPTNFRSSRIAATIYRDGKAICREIIQYGDANSTDEHRAGAQACLDKYNSELRQTGYSEYQKKLVECVAGETPDNRGYVFLASDMHGWRFARGRIHAEALNGGKESINR